jgi:glutathione peroxidase
MSTHTFQAFITLSSLILMTGNLPAKDEKPAKSIYEQPLRDIDGKEITLADQRGKVLLIVNTASECGATPQYETLVALQKKFAGQGFTVLAFPANNFGGQEPGSNDEIKSFCATEYAVNFPLFAKVSVTGDDQHPLFSQLTQANNKDFTGEIQWNFEKFLIGKDGMVLRRFRTHVEPDDATVTDAIEAALEAEPSQDAAGGCNDC